MKRKNKHVVEDFMSSAVISLKETDTLRNAEFEMNVAEIRHIPVVDKGNHVVGVVSQRDVLRAVGKAVPGAPLPVAEVMSRNVETVRPTTPAHEAAAIMMERKIGCLPVVGEDEQLVGIITETDFLHVAEQALRGAGFSRSDD
ncbi:MAG: CBS domain-containing protein [Polyangiaceae bacterium]|nr:CBS domain-containing protein [Polyangiaceae bacterium]